MLVSDKRVYQACALLPGVPWHKRGRAVLRLGLACMLNYSTQTQKLNTFVIEGRLRAAPCRR
jgi:hypothetical protein